MMTRLRSLALVWVAVVAWSPALASPEADSADEGTPDVEIVDREWVEVRSPNFTLLSRLSESASRALMNELELFREVAALVMPDQRLDSPVPVHILLVPEGGEWMQLSPSEHLGGYFLPTMRERFIAVRAGRGDEWTIKHEYVHYIMWNQVRVGYPKWYVEGFAEFLSTVHRRGDQLLIGTVSNDRLEWLLKGPWVSTHDVLTAETLAGWRADAGLMFYAQSWALVHYLILGDQRDDAFMERFQQYLTAIEAGESSPDALESAFGIDEGELDYALRHYVGRRGTGAAGKRSRPIMGREHERLKPPPTRGKRQPLQAFAISADRFSSEWAMQVRRPAPAEIAQRLGSLQLFVAPNGLDHARALFEHGLSTAPEDARLHSGLGRVASAQGRSADAAEHFADALAYGPSDARVHLDLAESLLQRAEWAADDAERKSLVERARSHIRTSLSGDGVGAESNALMGRSYLLLGDDFEQAYASLEEAATILPTSLDIRIWLAEACLAVGRDEEAEVHARAVLNWAPEGGVHAREAENLLTMLSAMRHRESRPAAEPGARATSRKPWRRAPATRFQESLPWPSPTPSARFDVAPAPPPDAEEEAAPTLSSDAVAFLEKTIRDADNPVTMFAREWCEFCWSGRKFVAECDIAYQSIDLDPAAYRGGRVGRPCACRTQREDGHREIPKIFVGGELIGGCTEAFGAFKEGALQTRLRDSGAFFDARVKVDPYDFLPTWLHPR